MAWPDVCLRATVPQAQATKHGGARLPRGPYRVVLKEPSEEAFRRGMKRDEHRRQRGSFEVFVNEMGKAALGHVMKRALGKDLPEPVAPEEQLAAAVARIAHLPDDALIVPKGMYEKRFRLVEGVSRDAAEHLAQAARAMSFQADVHHEERANTRGQLPPQALVLGFLMPAAIMLVAGAGWMPAALLTTIGASIFVGTRVGASTRSDPVLKLSLAFGHDLRVHVRAPYADLVGTPSTEPATPVPAPQQAPPDTLDDHARERVARLLADLKAADLPELIAHDLHSAAKALSDEAERLIARRASLKDALDDAQPEHAIEEALATVQDRIRRLETLRRAGQAIDDDELATLRDAEAMHLTTQAQADDTHRAHVAATARLLEIAAAAQATRRDLFDTTTPSQPLTDVVAQLRRDVATVVTTEASLGRRAAMARQAALKAR